MLELVRAPIAPRYVPQDADWDLAEPHRAVWQAVRHLFPDHAVPTQTDHGYLMVSWKIPGPSGRMHYAAPFVIHIEPGLLLALWTCDDDERREIAALQVEAVDEALDRYDPRSRITTWDAVLLGDG